VAEGCVEMGAVVGFVGALFEVEVVRVDERERLVDEDGWVNKQAVPHDLSGQCIGVILADASEFGTAMEDLFQAPLIFEKPGGIAFRTELPGHVADSPETCAAIAERVVEQVFQSAQHEIDIEAPIGEVLLIGGEDQAVLCGLSRDVDTGGGEIGTQAGNHVGTVEIEAAIILPELFAHRLDECGEMLRGGSRIDEAVMAGFQRHGRHYIYG
jgi:hypothetical protein